MARAPFILIEGLDRSGKTTQTSILAERVAASGKRVKLLKFPGKYRELLRN
jgi:dTMP kinase